MLISSRPQRGTIEEWNRHIGKTLFRDPSGVLAVGVALTAPLIEPFDIQPLRLYVSKTCARRAKAFKAGVQSVYAEPGPHCPPEGTIFASPDEALGTDVSDKDSVIAEQSDSAIDYGFVPDISYKSTDRKDTKRMLLMPSSKDNFTADTVASCTCPLTLRQETARNDSIITQYAARFYGSIWNAWVDIVKKQPIVTAGLRNVGRGCVSSQMNVRQPVDALVLMDGIVALKYVLNAACSLGLFDLEPEVAERAVDKMRTYVFEV